MVWSAGQWLHGNRYKIEKQIGAGGMGVAYLACNRQGKRVVLKTLREQILKSPSADRFCARFKDEALKLSLCRHPHIVAVENAFSEMLTIGNQSLEVPHLSMEFIEGENLAERIERSGKLTETEALSYIRQIGSALELVHEKGLLHRDIKPSNIMIRQDQPEAVLIDFGLARGFIPNVPQQLTVAFTQGFAPPEQYSDTVKMGEYVDVYALAGTLYFLLTATLPPSAMDRMMHVPLTSVRHLNPAISEQTSRAVAKGMELSITDRPATITAWLELLPLPNNATTVLSVSVPSPIVTAAAVPTPATPPTIEQLNAFLSRQQWHEADRVTALLLCSAAQKAPGNYLSVSDIQRLPSHLLFSVDRLWTKYSQGHFGFRIQRQLWASLGLPWGTIPYPSAQTFGHRIGWVHHEQWIEYRQLQFSPSAPQGHLPSWRSGGKVVSWVAGRLGYFLDRWH